MLGQKDVAEMYDECFTVNERLTRFRKCRERILGRVKEKICHLFKEPNITRNAEL